MSLTSRTSAPLLAALAALLVVVALAFRPILAFHLTGWDTILHIKTASSIWPAWWRFLLVPLTPGTGWYRPLSGLSYGLDYSLWGLSPFGYHLTDLVLHSACVIGVLVLAYLVTRSVGWATLAGLAFALHPALTPVVANIAQRHDTLMTLGVLWTLVLLQVALRSSGARRALWFAFAGLSFAVALGAKETGLVALPLVLWLLYRSHGRVRRAFAVEAAPFLALAALFLFGRQLILWGLPPPAEFGTTPNLLLPLLYARQLAFPELSSIPALWVCAILLTLAIAWLVRSIPRDHARVTWLVLFLMWLAMPLILYVAVNVEDFFNRYGYVLVPPLVLLLIFLLASPLPAYNRYAHLALLAARAILLLTMLGWLLVSPLGGLPVQLVERETAAGEYLAQMDQVAATLPAGTLILLRNAPARLANRHALQDWLDLKWPARRLLITGATTSPNPRGHVQVTVTALSDNRVLIDARYQSLSQE